MDTEPYKGALASVNTLDGSQLRLVTLRRLSPGTLELARMELQGVDHVAFAVSDQEASIAWYRTVLGLNEEHREWQRHPAMLMRGGSGVALFAADGTAPGNDEPRFLHLAFRVDRASFAEAQERLAELAIAFDLVDHGSAHSIYFHDPDGVRLELTTYEV